MEARTIKRYIKKNSGLVVEAAQLGEDNVSELANWAQAQMIEERDALSNEPQDALNVKTPHGTKRLSQTMWLIWLNGYFFVSDDDNFLTNFDLKVEAKPQPLFHDPFRGVGRVGDS